MSQPAKMVYYMRHVSLGQVNIESAIEGEPVENLRGFIRLVPEITKPHDVNEEMIAALKVEADAWMLANPGSR